MNDEIHAGEKKSVNVHWPSAEVGQPEDIVRLRFFDPKENKWSTVRRVDNEPDKNGEASATVTFPKNFKGDRKIRVKGPDGEVEGEIKV